MRNYKKSFLKKLLVSTILSGNIVFAFEASAYSLDIERTKLERPWGYQKRGSEILVGNYSMRDRNGNLVIRNGFDGGGFVKGKGSGYNFTSNGKLNVVGAGSNAGNGIKLTANEFTLVSSGTFNTVIVTNNQQTLGDVTLNGELSDFE